MFRRPLIVILSLFSSTLAFSQAATTDTTMDMMRPQAMPAQSPMQNIVLSPEAFQSAVSVLDKKNKDNLEQELKRKIEQTNAARGTQPGSNDNQATSPANTVAAKPVAPAETPAPQPTQQSVYTGFGNQPPAPPPPQGNSGSGSTSGLGIQY